ncbi:dnaJ homolog subfamily C member 21, partial [Amblyraja radiata]|uniref:dnaJ homolog subfamily C member 21 n=1 Tax=Amblyraja radiata TaxID=386614 RepID=UPI001404062A
MRCHYEALGLPRDANAEDVKRAHRRLALLHHPDKNPDCPEDAAEQFKLIQAAYDVLSDPQERAWYDSHREAILRSGQDGEAEDDSHELLQFFTGACYSGFTDSPQGFYAVYRAVFAGIAEQEVEGAPSAEELVFPTFGHSGSDHQTVVHSFYAHWQSFCTHRTLSWAESFDTRHADNRWHKRAMEKENRRARERARRKYNQLVQQLAAFVRRRDPRVQAHRLHLQQVNAQKHQRAQQLQRQQAQRQARLAMEYQEQSWVKLSDLERELRQMEAQYQQEFGDGSEETTSSEEDGLGEDGGGEMVQDHDADDHLFCPACDRTFQSVKTMRNHERSRRHRETVALLRQQLEAEERELQEAQSGQELPPSTPRLSKKDRRKKRHKVFTHTPASPTDSDTTDSDSQSEAESGQGQEGGRGGEEGSSGEEGGIVEQEADSQGQERGGREQDESTQERAKCASQGERTEQGEKAEGDGDGAEVMVEQGMRAEAMVQQGEGAEA